MAKLTMKKVKPLIYQAIINELMNNGVMNPSTIGAFEPFTTRALVSFIRNRMPYFYEDFKLFIFTLCRDAVNGVSVGRTFHDIKKFLPPLIRKIKECS